MSGARELAFRTAVLLAAASGLVAIAAALGERSPLTLGATAAAALATVAYLGWALVLRGGRGLFAANLSLSVPLALALAGWSLALGSPAACAALAIPALVGGVLGRPPGAIAQGVLCVALAAGVAAVVGFTQAWLVPLGATLAAGVAGALVSLARRSASASSPLGRALFSALPMGVLIVDGDRIVRANPAIGALTRQAPENLLGLPVLHIIAPEFREAVGRRLDAVAPGTLEIHARRDDGTLFDASVTVAPLDTLQLVLVQDRSDRAKAERAKDEFLSTVSHELRTPLASINGALSLIEGGAAGDVSEKAGELVALGKRNTDRLLRLVNDILDLKRIEAGRMRLRRRAIEAHESVVAALDGLAVIAEDAQVTLERSGAADAQVWADPDRVVQVLTNLVSNAIKFAPEGSAVTVALSMRGDFVRFTVADRGPGIPEDEQERLFSRFQQLDQSDARSVQGSGLGLAIAKAIVKQHGGEIGIETANEGATFYFELPCASESDSVEMDSMFIS